jgi:hypothetical protein
MELVTIGVITILLIIALLVFTIFQIKKESDPLGLASLGALLILAAFTWFYYPAASPQIQPFLQDLMTYYRPTKMYGELYEAFTFFAYWYGAWLLILACVRVTLKQELTRILGGATIGGALVSFGYILNEYSHMGITGNQLILQVIIVLGILVMLNSLGWYRARIKT